jgi:type II secretory pathway component PulF
VNLLVIVPRFEPIFKQLEEKGKLPQMTHWLMAFGGLNALLLALALLTVAEVVVRILRRKARGNFWSWLWVAAVALAAMPAILLVIIGLLLPVFVMGEGVQ